MGFIRLILERFKECILELVSICSKRAYLAELLRIGNKISNWVEGVADLCVAVGASSNKQDGLN